MTSFSTLHLRGVGRRFGKHDALADLDLEIGKGEFIALLGPSGCGKSTALNCLAGLLPLTAGSIWQDDTRIDVLPPEKRGFGMVFQNYALFPHLSVRRNVAFGLRMRRVSKPELNRRTDEAIRLVRLEEHAHKLPGQLSGGQQQRVAIARAIVLEPSLVLMDEPLSNLDAKLRLEMRTEIRRLHQSLGLTTVYVTHDQEEALSLADRLVVLRDGRVQQIGTPEQLHTRPANWHVADFMGYRNLLPCTAGARSGEAVAVEGDGLRLLASPVGDLPEGAAAVAAVRPEDVTVTEGSPAGPNRIEATVEVVEYQGRELAVEARTAGGTRLHIRTGRRLAPGDEVVLDIAVERLLAFAQQYTARAGEPADTAGRPVLAGQETA
ncbi:ABC transporter ATP-binding protein [Prauserella muralis]|uniref:Spermidine/putrescine ABC transporter ATP-binding protein n=1 Tax=Prauserella muralis TaxID=588067 RepID=A0A2V4APP6_9PSEU|nr:ABC transporter ATP-binding protein [Prauserella muralis]PXY22572.1 spermidine/putrescine ABC transporter ATP-binding protein [Prauserella muralis]TWE28265.1 putative spermidine/putrescine transport system ATP-binding protein [Prauserella muralis]